MTGWMDVDREEEIPNRKYFPCTMRAITRYLVREKGQRGGLL